MSRAADFVAAVSAGYLTILLFQGTAPICIAAQGARTTSKFPTRAKWAVTAAVQGLTVIDDLEIKQRYQKRGASQYSNGPTNRWVYFADCRF